jgi:hypothetical protein
MATAARASRATGRQGLPLLLGGLRCGAGFACDATSGTCNDPTALRRARTARSAKRASARTPARACCAPEGLACSKGNCVDPASVGLHGGRVGPGAAAGAEEGFAAWSKSRAAARSPATPPRAPSPSPSPSRAPPAAAAGFRDRSADGAGEPRCRRSRRAPTEDRESRRPWSVLRDRLWCSACGRRARPEARSGLAFARLARPASYPAKPRCAP